MGAIGGGIWHGIKGARNSPRVSFSHLVLSIVNNQLTRCSPPLSSIPVRSRSSFAMKNRANEWSDH